MIFNAQIGGRIVRAFLLITLVAVSYATTKAQAKPGELKIEPYTFKTFDGKEMPAEMGRLIVLEKRSNPSGKTIELVFVRLKSTAPNPGPPLFVLAGGPGGSGITETKIFFHVFQQLLGLGDVIAVEQRGTGQTRPVLACRIQGFAADALASRENFLRYARDSFRPCADYWRKQGIDLSAYNTAESASDIDDLRRALGAPKINLWGFSYGTHLGLAVMRQYPQSINRAVLSGVEGPNHTRKLPSNIERHLQDIAQLVRQDPEWSKLIPDFPGLMRTVLAALDKQPATVEVLNRQTKQTTRVAVGKFALQFLTALGVGDSKDIARFPLLYYSIQKGDLSLLQKEVQSLQDRITSPAPWAMTFSMDCASGATPERDRKIQREAARTILGDSINAPWPDICDVWGSPDAGDNFRSAIRSTVPTLFISGTMDGRAPISNADEVRKGFRHSATFIVEGAAHEDLFKAPATLQVINEFLSGKPISLAKTSIPALKFLPPPKTGAK